MYASLTSTYVKKSIHHLCKIFLSTKVDNDCKCNQHSIRSVFNWLEFECKKHLSTCFEVSHLLTVGGWLESVSLSRVPILLNGTTKH